MSFALFVQGAHRWTRTRLLAEFPDVRDIRAQHRPGSFVFYFGNEGNRRVFQESPERWVLAPHRLRVSVNPPVRLGVFPPTQLLVAYDPQTPLAAVLEHFQQAAGPLKDWQPPSSSQHLRLDFPSRESTQRAWALNRTLVLGEDLEIFGVCQPSTDFREAFWEYDRQHMGAAGCTPTVIFPGVPPHLSGPKLAEEVGEWGYVKHWEIRKTRRSRTGLLEVGSPAQARTIIENSGRPVLPATHFMLGDLGESTPMSGSELQVTNLPAWIERPDFQGFIEFWFGPLTSCGVATQKGCPANSKVAYLRCQSVDQAQQIGSLQGAWYFGHHLRVDQILPNKWESNESNCV